MNCGCQNRKEIITAGNKPTEHDMWVTLALLGMFTLIYFGRKKVS